MIKCRFEKIVDSNALFPGYVRDPGLISINRPGIHDITRGLNIDYTIIVDALISGEVVSIDLMIPKSIRFVKKRKLPEPSVSEYYRMFLEFDQTYIDGRDLNLTTVMGEEQIRVIDNSVEESRPYRIGYGVFALENQGSFVGLAVDRNSVWAG